MAGPVGSGFPVPVWEAGSSAELLCFAVCCMVHVHLRSGFMPVDKIEKDFSLAILLPELFQSA